VSGGDFSPWENARYLAGHGHSVTFVASRFRGAAKEETLDGVRVVRLGGLLSQWLRCFLYYMLHARGRYDVVVAEGFGGSRIPRLTPLYVKEPMITEWHQVHRDLFEQQYPWPLRPALNVLERLTAFVHRNTAIRANTVEWQHAFQALGFKPENIFVLPVSIREDWFLETRSARISAPLILCLNRFLRYKCLHHVVLAMEEVLKVVPDAQLVLAGRRADPRYATSVLRLIRELSLERNIVVRFDVSEAEKRTLLGHARVMVVPSAVEGFGLVVLEANARGLPVVASSRVPEAAVQQGGNGLRYKFGDISDLAACVVRVLQDDRLHLKLSAGAVQFVSRFAWRNIGAEYERVILKVAAGERTGRQPFIGAIDGAPPD